MIRRPPRSTLFPTRRSSDLVESAAERTRVGEASRVFAEQVHDLGRMTDRLHLLGEHPDRKSTRLNSSHGYISYAVFCLKKKKHTRLHQQPPGAACARRSTAV